MASARFRARGNLASSPGTGSTLPRRRLHGPAFASLVMGWMSATVSVVNRSAGSCCTHLARLGATIRWLERGASAIVDASRKRTHRGAYSCQLVECVHGIGQRRLGNAHSRGGRLEDGDVGLGGPGSLERSEDGVSGSWTQNVSTFTNKTAIRLLTGQTDTRLPASSCYRPSRRWSGQIPVSDANAFESGSAQASR